MDLVIHLWAQPTCDSRRITIPQWNPLWRAGDSDVSRKTWHGHKTNASHRTGSGNAILNFILECVAFPSAFTGAKLSLSDVSVNQGPGTTRGSFCRPEAKPDGILPVMCLLARRRNRPVKSRLLVITWLSILDCYNNGRLATVWSCSILTVSLELKAFGEGFCTMAGRSVSGLVQFISLQNQSPRFNNPQDQRPESLKSYTVLLFRYHHHHVRIRWWVATSCLVWYSTERGNLRHNLRGWSVRSHAWKISVMFLMEYRRIYGGPIWHTVVLENIEVRINNSMHCCHVHFTTCIRPVWSVGGGGNTGGIVWVLITEFLPDWDIAYKVWNSMNVWHVHAVTIQPFSPPPPTPTPQMGKSYYNFSLLLGRWPWKSTRHVSTDYRGHRSGRPQTSRQDIRAEWHSSIRLSPEPSDGMLRVGEVCR